MLGKVPSLSLIVPSYNHGKYLYDLIYSIYGGETSLGYFTEQTLLPDEVIIADDCSTDDTESIVNELASKFPNIKYVRTLKNSGTPVACNTAVFEAKGEIITRIDADDMRESDSLELMMKAQIDNMHSMIYDDGTLFVDGKRMPHPFKMADYDFNKLIHKNTIHAGVMYPKKAWEECGGYRERFRYGRDDWSFNVALGIVGYCGIHIDKSGYLYRRERQNRSLTNSSSERQAFFYGQMKKEFSDIYAGRLPMSCCGNRSKSVPTTNTNVRVSMELVGSAGMTLLVYQGSNYGSEIYYGPITGLGYEFSVKKNKRYVDDRDLHTPKNTGLLDLVDHGKYVFALATVDPAPVVVETVEEPKVEAVAVEEEVQMLSATSLVEPEAEMVMAEIPEGDEEMTTIEAGVIRGIGAKSVEKLAEAGIFYWEQFVSTESNVLADILGSTVETIDEQKDSFV